MSRPWRWVIAAAIAAVAVTGWSSPVSAHAELLSSDPAAASVLAASPGEIVLTFTEPVDPTEDAVRLVDAGGAPVETGEVTQDLGSESITAAIAGELADGSYVVAWSVVSADSHPIRGAFVFSVGAPSPGAEDLVGDVIGSTGTETSMEGWLGVGRFASYLGIAVLVGTLAAAATVAASVLHRRRLGYVLFAGGYLAVLGTIVMICAQASVIGSSFTDWSAVVGTRSGGWWLARLVIVAAATMLVPWRHLAERRLVQVLGAICSVALFAVVAAGGHAVSGRAISVGFAATVVHLAAMAVWVGGLGLIVLVAQRDTMVATASRFSPLALGAVVVLALTGVVNGWRQIGTLDGITDSSYGRWLIVKVVIVAGVVAVAAVSRRLLRRHADAASSAKLATVSADAMPADQPGDRRLRRSVLVEAIGMIIVLAATAGLTGATPPRQAGAAAAVDVSVTAVQDDHFAQIDLLPAVTGGTVMHVTITSGDGDLEQADEITVAAELPEQQVGPIDIDTFPAGPNHVTTNEANFPIPGRWTITVTARYGEFDQLVFTTAVDVPAP